jgi:uncharacterized repeat protein (TIGR01451 family)
MKLIKLRQPALAVFLGLAVWGLFLFAMGHQAAQSAPLPQQPILNISKQSAGNWLKRVKLVFTNTVSEELVDFPVLVVLTSDRINYADTQDEGQDIRFVDGDGTILPHEIETWDESGSSYVWVKVPSISATSGTDFIWLYFGNPDAPDGQQPAAVWSSGYRGVWHLNGNLEDATNVNNGLGASVTSRSGWIAGGQDFDGDQAYINVGSNNSVDNVFTTGGTVMAWINPRTFGKAGYGRIADKSNTTTAGDGWAFELYKEISNGVPRNTIRFERDFFPQRGSWYAPVNSIITDSWQLVAVTFDDRVGAQRPAFYVNGVATAVITEDVKNGTPEDDDLTDLYLGNFPGFLSRPMQDDRSFDGGLDEIRIVARAQSTEWILAQYRSMSDNFIQYSSPEVTSLPADGIVGAPLTYTLTVSNSGAIAATDVVVTDTLPAGANYVRGGQFSAGNQTVLWTIPAVAASTSQTVTFVVTTCELVLVNQDYQVVASDGGYTSLPGEPAITLLTTPTLAAAVEHDPLPVVIGQPFFFTSTSTTNGGAINDWQWTFGDGGTDQGKTVSHIYSGPGIYTVTLTITDSCGYTASASKTLNVYSPTLNVTKYSDPEPVGVGQRMNYTVVISNSGQSPATGVVVSDTLPVATTLIPGSVEITPSGAGNVIEAPPEIASDLTVLDQSVVTVTYGVTVNGPLASGTVLTNTVDVYGLQTPVPVRDVVTSTVFNLPDLRVSKTSSHPVPLLSGDLITYTIVVSNAADLPLTGVVISDSVPANTRFVSDSIRLYPSNAGDVGIAPPLLVTKATISGGERITATMVVRVETPPAVEALITNTAVVTSVEVSTPVTARVIDSFTLPAADLTITKSSEPLLPLPGQILTYTIIVRNTGPNDVTGALISDTVPAVLIDPDWSCSAIGTDCPAASGTGDLSQSVNLPASSQLTYVITAGIPGDFAGELVNTATVTVPLGIVDPDLTNNTAVDQSTLYPVVSFSDTEYSAGEAAGTVPITVTLNAASIIPVTVTYVVTDGTATVEDYQSDIGQLSFSPGITSQILTVTIFDDDLVEDNETVNIELRGAINARGTPTQTVLTIIDDDFEPALLLTKAGPTTAAVGETARFTFTVEHAPASDQTPVNSVSVTDDVAGAAALVPGSNGDGDQWLEGGEVWTYTVVTIIQPTMPNPLVNTGRVVAADLAGKIVTATAKHTTTLGGFDPRLFVDVDGPAQARLQERITITYTVINVNILALLMYELSEIGVAAVGDGSPIDLISITADVPTGPTEFVDGDFNRNGQIDAAEAWIYTTSYTVSNPVPDPILITVTAIGQDAEGDVISAAETLVLDIIDVPDLNITSGSYLTATVGQMVPLTLTVSHDDPNNDLPVLINSVTDNVFGVPVDSGIGDTNGNARLDFGEMWTYRFSYTVRATDPNQLVHVTTIDGQVLDGDHFKIQTRGVINIDKPPLDKRLYLPSIFKKSSN